MHSHRPTINSALYKVTRSIHALLSMHLAPHNKHPTPARKRERRKGKEGRSDGKHQGREDKRANRRHLTRGHRRQIELRYGIRLIDMGVSPRPGRANDIGRPCGSTGGEKGPGGVQRGPPDIPSNPPLPETNPYAHTDASALNESVLRRNRGTGGATLAVPLLGQSPDGICAHTLAPPLDLRSCDTSVACRRGSFSSTSGSLSAERERGGREGLLLFPARHTRQRRTAGSTPEKRRTVAGVAGRVENI
ncbi:unnamed protein product [Arctogadus glacialis]